MKNNVIEDFLWVEVFEANILKFTLLSVFLIVLTRGTAIFLKLKSAKSFVYFSKALTYGYLVILLTLYFFKVKNAMQHINVFTGFTFLFSAVELVDNLILAFIELFSKSKHTSGYLVKKLNRQHREMQEIVDVLMNVKLSLQPGRVNKKTIKYVMKFDKAYKCMNFDLIDEVIKLSTHEEFCFSDTITRIRLNKMISEIIARENKKKEAKKIRKSLSYNKEECENLTELFNGVKKYRSIYCKEVNRLLNEKEILAAVEEL